MGIMWFFLGLGGFLCLLAAGEWFEARAEKERAIEEYWQARTRLLETNTENDESAE